MSRAATRYLYLARHGEALPDGSGLSDAGRQQAILLGQRLRTRPITVVHHGPLPRALQTARMIGEEMGGVSLTSSTAAGDYVPYVPDRNELPTDIAEVFLRFLEQVTAEAAEGQALAEQAVAQFTGPTVGDTDRHELVITHNFLIAWLVRQALDAPRWRWLGLNFGNAALTVIRYAPDRPPSLLIYNDMSHLPPELRWTGFPPEWQV
ncbi:MAG: putative phosphoglycerate mutase [Ktedonobacterales bacterium]|jgi:probable phosphoglycerate mutase|nr:MAG: putative phosphoglycerate mutase [Ktedonobacterales bacterium]